jgi:hypothetical protein
MQVVKALVIGMGFLILVGLAILVYGLTNKFGSSPSPAGGQTAATAAGDAAVPAFGTIRAALPAGATVAGVQMQGGAVMVHLTMPDGGAQIMVFRLSDGRQTGTIELQPQR